MAGIEPVTSWSQVFHSKNLATVSPQVKKAKLLLSVLSVDGISRSCGRYKEFRIAFGYGTAFLAHPIRISEILPWDRKSYLTHAILPRLPREGFIHLLYWYSHTLSSGDVIVMFK